MFARVFSPRHLDARVAWLAGFVLCLAVLAGCAVSRPSIALPDMATWELRQGVLATVSEWEFHGRIAVQAGAEGFNGKLNWTQSGNHFRATVSGPLGLGSVTMAGSDGAIILTDKNGVKQALADPERELYYRYGWTIPVASLRYWALGIPSPARAAATEVDDAGRMVDLRQSDWTVHVSRYRESAGQQMPRKLTATSADTRVRLVIDKWLFFDR